MQIVTKKDRFEDWYKKTNIISEENGDIDNLDTIDKSSLVNATNEIFNSFVLPEVLSDTSPELGSSLYLNNKNIDGTGNINITGIVTSTNIAGTITGVTQLISDESTKLATTEYTSLKISSMLSGVSIAGDLSGSMANLQINSNTISADNINANSFENNNDLQFIGTDGNGQLNFINTTELGADGGGDLSGMCNMLSVNPNTVSINELDLTDDSSGYLATTNGSAVLTFLPSVSFSIVTATLGQTTFLIDYNIGQIVIYMNGVKLIRGVDFTASNGTDIVLSTPTIDSITTIEFQRFNIL